MKLLKIRLSVVVEEVDGFGGKLIEGTKPEGFKVGNDQIFGDTIPDSIIDKQVQTMLVEALPLAYAESEKRWGK